MDRGWGVIVLNGSPGQGGSAWRTWRKSMGVRQKTGWLQRTAKQGMPGGVKQGGRHAFGTDMKNVGRVLFRTSVVR